MDVSGLGCWDKINGKSTVKDKTTITTTNTNNRKTTETFVKKQVTSKIQPVSSSTERSTEHQGHPRTLSMLCGTEDEVRAC